MLHLKIIGRPPEHHRLPSISAVPGVVQPVTLQPESFSPGWPSNRHFSRVWILPTLLDMACRKSWRSVPQNATAHKGHREQPGWQSITTPGEGKRSSTGPRLRLMTGLGAVKGWCFWVDPSYCVCIRICTFVNPALVNPAIV